MVKKERHIRAGEEFVNLQKRICQEIGGSRKIGSREFTDSLARFVINEDLDRVMINRGKRKRGGGLF